MVAQGSVRAITKPMNCLSDAVSNTVKKGNVYCFSVLFFSPFPFLTNFSFLIHPNMSML